MSRQLAGGEALERRKPIVDTCPVLAAELAVWGVLHAVRSVPRIHVFKATEDGGVVRKDQDAVPLTDEGKRR
jgi:hypothetical protein